jgi:Phytanoyl-CoA dioxygenase (PhyH)
VTVQGTGVTPEQREQFERDGFLIVTDPGYPESALEGAPKDVEGLYTKFPEEYEDENKVFYTWHRILDAWKISDNVKTIALNPRMHAILESLYGRKPLPFQTLNFPFGTNQKAHSDTIHFNSKPPGFMCGVWVAFEDIDMDNGPLFYYPGSHKLPEVTMQEVGTIADHSHYDEYEAYIGKVIEEHGLEPRYGLVKKGQAIIWSANILHGGFQQKDMERSRHSQVTHFYFEGCKYYTPLLSKDPNKEDETFWRDPDWIS